MHAAPTTDLSNVKRVQGDVVSDAHSRWLGSIRHHSLRLPGRTKTEQVEQISDEKPGTA